MVTPRRGMVLALAEPEYKFGAGPLLCRVLEVVAPVLFHDELWWHVRGECAYGTEERHGGRQTRELYVIDSVVPAYEAYLQKHPKEKGNQP